MHCGSVRLTKSRATLAPKASCNADRKSFSSIRRTSMSGAAVDDAKPNPRAGTSRAYSSMMRDIAIVRSMLPPPMTRARIGRSKRRMPSGRAPMRRSDPNANARKPLESSAAVKCVNSGGAPSNDPGGACCRPDAPRAAVTNEMRTMQPASKYFIVQSGFPPLADQAFLRHGGNQHPVTAEYKSTRVAARAVQVRGILCVKQPIVGAKRTMEPKRVIEARGHEFISEKGAAVRRERGIEQHHVGCIGEHALMDRGQIRQLSGGADPDIELSAGILLSEIAIELDRPKFDRSLALVIPPHRIRHHRQQFLAHIGVARKFLRWRHIRHFCLMAQARFIRMK